MNEQIETWKPVTLEGYGEFYQVSNLGRVKSLKYGKERILKTSKDRSGYLYFNLYFNLYCKAKKTNTICFIHKLVLLSFKGQKPFEKAVVNHINGIKTDNRVENLEWVTRSYNVLDSFKRGRLSEGGTRKINETQAMEIFNLKGIETLSTIANKFGISIFQVSAIHNKKRWKHIHTQIDGNLT